MDKKTRREVAASLLKAAEVLERSTSVQGNQMSLPLGMRPKDMAQRIAELMVIEGAAVVHEQIEYGSNIEEEDLQMMYDMDVRVNPGDSTIKVGGRTYRVQVTVR